MQKERLLQLNKLMKNNKIILHKYKSEFDKHDNKAEFGRALSMIYCCHNTGWGGKDPGTLEEHEKMLLDAIDITAAIQIKIKYSSLIKMQSGWERHWIYQMSIRIERFKYITKKVFDKVDELLLDVNIDDYIKDDKNFKKLTKGFTVTLRQIENETLTYDQVLEGIANQKISVKESKKLLNKIEEDSQDKLCPFSGSGSNPNRATRICSRTGDPKKLGDCGSCRVAAEWEEVYG